MRIKNVCAFLLLLALLCTSCSIIDEDNSDCGKYNRID